MGMMIDTAITVLGMVEAHGICIEAKDVAVDTMRKYQQIEQIYKDWFSDAGHTSAEAYRRIGEVLKDGKNDR